MMAPTQRIVAQAARAPIAAGHSSPRPAPTANTMKTTSSAFQQHSLEGGQPSRSNREMRRGVRPLTDRVVSEAKMASSS